MPDRRPILVTGAHRSGTTWVGKMLAASPQIAYISEPLNVLHRLGVLRTSVAHWYTYICYANEDLYLPALNDTLAFRYHPLAEIQSLRSRKDIGRMFRDWNIFTQGRLFKRQPLLKDPFAVFSAPWFAERLPGQGDQHEIGINASSNDFFWHSLSCFLLWNHWNVRRWNRPNRTGLARVGRRATAKARSKVALEAAA